VHDAPARRATVFPAKGWKALWIVSSPARNAVPCLCLARHGQDACIDSGAGSSADRDHRISAYDRAASPGQHEGISEARP
jgi:hypothetical protein